MKISVLMENTSFAPPFIAEHGLSLFIETKRHKILFDTGQTGAFADNAEQLGIDLNDVDLAVISHGHNDHGGGLARFLEYNHHAPVYIRENAFDRYYHEPNLYRGLDHSLCHNNQLVFTGDSLKINDELELLSCNGMKAVYPTYNFGLCRLEKDTLVPDDFSHEQSLLIREGEHTVLLSGCSHKGVCNMTQWLHPDILIGGFHFKGIPLDAQGCRALDQAAAVLSAMPTVYYTGHCTGTEQYTYLKRKMGNQLHSFSSGQTFEIASDFSV